MARLEADWPLWEFWLVPAYIGPTWWCARRRDDHKRVLNARSAAGLRKLLEDAAGGSDQRGVAGSGEVRPHSAPGRHDRR